jgi:hypothetical protein
MTIPFTDYRLLFSPRWSELPGAVQVILLLVLCVVPAALMVWLYRYELKLVRRATALGLLALRLGALSFLLFILGLQPLVAHVPVESLPGRVLIAVDHSDSMEARDPQRSALDKLLLARALNLAGDLCTEQELASWIQAYQNNRTPEWVTSDEFPGEPEQRRHLAESRQRHHDEIIARIDAMTRARMADQLLKGSGRLLQTLRGRHHVESLGFAQEVWDTPEEGREKKDDDREMRDNSSPLDSARLTGFTDLNQPLEQALKRSGAGQGRIAGVVLLSDGQHNRGPAPVLKAEELKKWRIPIFPIALGDPKPPPDIALTKIEAPINVAKDTIVPIEARFQITGLAKQDIVATLEWQDQPADQAPLQTQVIHHSGKDGLAEPVRFQLKMDKPGTHALVVKARPVLGEARTDNNSRPVVIRVEDDNKYKVLVIDSEPRWEFHYLASALSRDPTIRLDQVLLKPPLLNEQISEDTLQAMGNPRRSLPPEPDAFKHYDCIILGDVGPDEMRVADRRRLENYVAEEGGTLVLVAGKRAMPQAYFSNPNAPSPRPLPRRGEGESGGDPLLKLLPLEDARLVNPVSGFPFALTRFGKGTKFLQMDANLQESDRRWADLPRHYWGVAGRAKPAANVLAYFQDEAPSPLQGRGQGEGASDEKQSRNNALAALQNYGLGRVLYLGVDSTWRWRYRIGDTYHHRFWSQIIRWAASDKPQTRFGTRAPVYAQGENVEVFVRLDAETIRSLPGQIEMEARILRLGAGGEGRAGDDEKPAAIVRLSGDARQQMLEKQVANLPPGNYAVELAIADPQLRERLLGKMPPKDRNRATFTVTAADSAEKIQLAANWDLLRDLAQKSGGQFLKVEDAGDLLHLLAAQQDQISRPTEHKLWQSWTTLVLVLLLLTLEWVGRKLAGLP